MMSPPDQLEGWRRKAAALADAGAAIADITGHFGSFVLLLLTLAIVLGISLRWIGVDNSWTYDLDLFTLVWTAFAGAVLTARRNRHITAGIALENILGGRGTVLSVIRFVIVGGFLVLFTASGYWAALESWQTQETTIDIAQWPMWIAKAALPVGTALWALAEAAKFLHRMAPLGGDTEPSDTALDL
jgi:TRAP-type C4-dicarboxylate transport system permease small subunit